MISQVTCIYMPMHTRAFGAEPHAGSSSCNTLRIMDMKLKVTEPCVAVQVGNVAPLNVTQFFDGLVTIVDPAAFSDTSAKIRASVVGSVIAATGMSLL